MDQANQLLTEEIRDPGTSRAADGGDRSLLRRRVPAQGDDIAAFIFASTAVVVASTHNGSYFAASWGWQALVFLGLSLTGLIFLVSVRIPRLQMLFLAGVAAFVAWVALSAFWSASVPASIREVERDVVYLSLALVLAVYGRYLSGRGLAIGVLGGIAVVSAYALTTKLFPTHFPPPDPVFADRLSVPLGYWNALGIFAAMGTVLAVGCAGHARSRIVRAGSAVAACVVVPTMLFTFSRGALAATVIGVIAMIGLDSRRIELLTSAIALAIPVGFLAWLGLASGPLTEPGTPVVEAAEAGRGYAVWVAALACAAVLLNEAAHLVIVRLNPGRSAERRFGIALVVAGLALAIGLVTALGGPARFVDRAWSAFRADYSIASPSNRDRFRSLSSNFRLEQWRVAAVESGNHPVVGGGAGTFEQSWYQLRKIDLTARDAHNLYLEVLAEMGAVGLLLLLFALVVPLVGLIRCRAGPLAPAAFGAYLAFLAHAGVDWDWEMVAVTSAAILVGSVGLVDPPPTLSPVTLGRWPRRTLVAASALMAVFAFVSYSGNRSVSESRSALDDGRLELAIRSAQRVTGLVPWSIAPWVALGDAQLATKDRAGARMSYREAAARDPRNWRVWLAIAEVSTGTERREALAMTRRLNPRIVIPGE